MMGALFGDTAAFRTLGASPRLVYLETDTVWAVQQALADRSYDDGGNDGVYGPRTQASLAAYQRAAGLSPADGQPDEQTLISLGLPAPWGAPSSPSGASSSSSPAPAPPAAARSTVLTKAPSSGGGALVGAAALAALAALALRRKKRPAP